MKRKVFYPVLLVLSVLEISSYSQTTENKYYDVSISLPDSMNYIKVSAKLDISFLNAMATDTLNIDLCNGFTCVFFDSLSIFTDNKKLDFIVKDETELKIIVPHQIKIKNRAAFTFTYILSKRPDFEKNQYSDFAFQSNKDDVHINAAITSTDNWIPKLHDAHSKRLPPFCLTIAIPVAFEVMASGKLQSISEEDNHRILVYKNYDKLTDRGLYFFINKNIKIEKFFSDGFKLTMYVPSDTLKGNIQYISDLIHKAYRYYESEFGKTDLNEYKINSFSNNTMTYSGLFNSCNVPPQLFTNPIQNNELFFPVRDLIHEVSHTWWGNIVAPDAENDYWLYEGFAKFSEPFFLKTIADNDIEKLYQKRLKITVAGKIDFIPPLKFKSSEMTNQTLKNDATYFQGGLFLLSLKQLVGEENFRKGMQQYIQDNWGQTVTSDDYFAAMQNNTGINIKDYYYDYLNKPGFAEYSTKILSSNKVGSAYLYIIEIANTSNKELFTNICINTDLQHDTNYIYIPKGSKKSIEVKSSEADTTNLITLDPDNIFLVRKQGICSPGAQFYTDKYGKIGVANILDESPFGRAGLKNYMTIVSIDGQDISQRNIFQQAQLIQCTKGTKLKVIAKTAENKEIEYTVVY